MEHVRNERKTLAAVNDHPFVTSLIASFSDEQSLYMLVIRPVPSSVSGLWTKNATVGLLPWG